MYINSKTTQHLLWYQNLAFTIWISYQLEPQKWIILQDVYSLIKIYNLKDKYDDVWISISKLDLLNEIHKIYAGT